MKREAFMRRMRPLLDVALVFWAYSVASNIAHGVVHMTDVAFVNAIVVGEWFVCSTHEQLRELRRRSLQRGVTVGALWRGMDGAVEKFADRFVLTARPEPKGEKQ